MDEADETSRATSFTALYKAHSREIYRFALYLSGDPAMAEDIVSETFLRVWDSSAKLRMETVRGYLLTIARNVYLHDLRRKSRYSSLDDRDIESAAVVREFELKDSLRDVLSALQTLPEIDRAALLLHAEQGVPYQEIARILSLSLSAVKVKIYRTRLKLAEYCNKGAVRASN